MICDVTYFINKFEAIPEERWTTGTFRSFNDQCCALGHCLNYTALYKINNAGVIDGNCQYKPTRVELENEFAESFALCRLFNYSKPNSGSKEIIDINNGNDFRYSQPTPKQRILAALYDIKKMQSKDIDTGGKEEKKERIVYVSVPVSITEQSKDLVLS